MKEFKTGRTYIMRFEDQNVNVYFKIESRTAKTLNLINLSGNFEKKRYRIKIFENIEYCHPDGNYSFILKADEEVFNISITNVQTVLNDILEQINDPETDKKQIELSLNLALEKSRKLAKLQFDSDNNRYK